MQYDELPPEAEANNWFSVPFVSKVHGDWVELDADESGLLNEAELMRFGSGGLTEPFVKRVFQYCQTYMGKHGREIDYTGVPRALFSHAHAWWEWETVHCTQGVHVKTHSLLTESMSTHRV